MDERLQQVYAAVADYSEICLKYGIDSLQAIQFRNLHSDKPTFLHITKTVHESFLKKAQQEEDRDHQGWEPN
ncbi:MAG: hypothetical protein AAGI37_20850 [Planctomycetota bacterium]